MSAKTTITKSDFVRYLECPRYAWLHKNRLDLRDKTESRLAKQGMKVEILARGLFPDGKEVPWGRKPSADAAAKETARLMAEPDTQVIYQATIKTDKYLVRADIIQRDKDGRGWHLYEVKSSTKEKDTHIHDISFQDATFDLAGILLYSLNLVHINNKYVFDGKAGLEIHNFFHKKDLTHKIRKNLDENKEAMTDAHAALTSPVEPRPEILQKTFQYAMSEAMEKYYWKDVPDFSIYDIAGKIPKKKFDALIAEKIIKIEDIPADFFSSAKQNTQVLVTKTKEQLIDHEKLRETFATFQYPLYFLDYETVGPAIPLYDGTHPFQAICFQYSLHVLRAPGTEPEHYEFLHTGKDNPTPYLLNELESRIGDSGTIFVWSSFEKTRNNKMSEAYPEYRDFLERTNGRLHDLMKVLKDCYVDYRFKGSASIKNVLPVLVPELSYESLGLQQGMMASDTWLDLMENKTPDREKTVRDLLEYCGMDTLAMVKIYEFLGKLVG